MCPCPPAPDKVGKTFRCCGTNRGRRGSISRDGCDRSRRVRAGRRLRRVRRRCECAVVACARAMFVWGGADPDDSRSTLPCTTRPGAAGVASPTLRFRLSIRLEVSGPTTSSSSERMACSATGPPSIRRRAGGARFRLHRYPPSGPTRSRSGPAPRCSLSPTHCIGNASVAYRPGTNSWRRLPDPPAPRNGPRDVGGGVWRGRPCCFSPGNLPLLTLAPTRSPCSGRTPLARARRPAERTDQLTRRGAGMDRKTSAVPRHRSHPGVRPATRRVARAARIRCCGPPCRREHLGQQRTAGLGWTHPRRGRAQRRCALHPERATNVRRRSLDSSAADG